MVSSHSKNCFCREVKNLRDKPASEGDDFRNKALEQHQRHCISPDRLYEVVRRRVLFRPEHGQHSNRYELLHSPRLMVVQDNVEVKEPQDEAVYSTVMGTPNYRFVMEAAINNRQGKKTTDLSGRMHVIKHTCPIGTLWCLCAGGVLPHAARKNWLIKPLKPSGFFTFHQF